MDSWKVITVAASAAVAVCAGAFVASRKSPAEVRPDAVAKSHIDDFKSADKQLIACKSGVCTRTSSRAERLLSA